MRMAIIRTVWACNILLWRVISKMDDRSDYLAGYFVD